MRWVMNIFIKPEATKLWMSSSWPPGVVPESQCQVKREQKKARDKDKKDYPSVGSPIAEDKAAPISPVSKDVSKGVEFTYFNYCHVFLITSFSFLCAHVSVYHLSVSLLSFSNHLLSVCSLPSHEYWVGWLYMSVYQPPIQINICLFVCLSISNYE